MRTVGRIGGLALVLLVAACGGTEADVAPDTEADAIEESADLSATHDGYRFHLKFSASKGGKAILRGTGSAPIRSAFAYVPDDEVGTTTVSRGAFNTAFLSNELSGFLSGSPLRVRLSAGAAGRERTRTAKADLRASLVRRSGTTTLRPRAWFQAFRVGDATVVRLRGTAKARVTRVDAKIGTTRLSGVGSGKEWLLDVPVALFSETVAANRTISLTVVAGSTLKAGFTARATVARLTLTDGDPDALWPAPTCTDTLRRCLAAAGSDTSACGDAWTVQHCAGRPIDGIGPLTAADATGWMNAALEELAAEFAPHYARILGETRGDALFDAVTLSARTAAGELVGRSFATPEQLLAAAADLARPLLVKALARPLSFIPASAPIPGDVARARVIATEAVLAYLAGIELTRTEYGRPLEVLATTYTASWVQGLEDLRNGTGEAGTDERPTEITVLGRVLSSHVEVGVSRSTGRSLGVHFEID